MRLSLCTSGHRCGGCGCMRIHAHPVNWTDRRVTACTHTHCCSPERLGQPTSALVFRGAAGKHNGATFRSPPGDMKAPFGIHELTPLRVHFFSFFFLFFSFSFVFWLTSLRLRVPVMSHKMEVGAHGRSRVLDSRRSRPVLDPFVSLKTALSLEGLGARCSDSIPCCLLPFLDR